MTDDESGARFLDVRAVRRARAVAVSGSVRRVVDSAVVDEHLHRYLAGEAEKDFVCELIEGQVIGATGVRAILGDMLPVANQGTLFVPGSSLFVPIVGIDDPLDELGDESHDGPRFASVDDDACHPLAGQIDTLTQSFNFASKSAQRSSSDAPEGYGFVRMLGRGGMGEILEVRDEELKRHVALKRIRADRRDRQTESLFLQEAQITAQLEHPNIPPVHAYGHLPSGEPYFTMKRVQGHTLRALMKKRQQGDPEADVIADAQRIALVCIQVLQALSYAHARCVVHCDLKPENILLGAHGELLVMDWGLAALTGTGSRERIDLSSEVVTRGSGTPPYMAPEQLIGDVLDARTDVYGLGVVLFELLTDHLPYGSVDVPAETLVEMFTRGPPSPRLLAPHRNIDDELEAICQGALAPRQEERFADADALRSALEQWLTGMHRRRLAREKLEQGESAERLINKLLAEQATLKAEAGRLRETLKSWHTPAEKQPLWVVEDRLAALDLELGEAHADVFDAYSRAVGYDPSFNAAVDRLADLHLNAFLSAEADGDRAAMLLHRRGVLRHHRGRHTGVLEGRGSLTLLPDIDDARVRGWRLVDTGRIIARDAPLDLPPRIEGLSLPMGSYLFVVDAPDRVDQLVHVHIERGGSVMLTPRLFTRDEVGSDCVPIPAGPFLYGGDRHALNAGPREVRSTGAFAIARTAVTCREYLAFLHDVDQREPEQAARHVPRTRPDGGFLWPRGDDGRYTIPREDADGNPAVPEAPVMGVSFLDAVAYAAWKREREGIPWRLPTEVEWEKAARGVDGRFFPWGNGFDATFCKMALSRAGRPQPEPVGSFPVDTSVYGMQDAAGGIREWCSSFYDEAHETRVLRGGAWYFNAAYCRLAFRHGYLPHIVFTNFGIRLCHTLP